MSPTLIKHYHLDNSCLSYLHIYNLPLQEWEILLLTVRHSFTFFFLVLVYMYRKFWIVNLCAHRNNFSNKRTALMCSCFPIRIYSFSLLPFLHSFIWSCFIRLKIVQFYCHILNCILRSLNSVFLNWCTLFSFFCALYSYGF